MNFDFGDVVTLEDAMAENAPILNNSFSTPKAKSENLWEKTAFRKVDIANIPKMKTGKYFAVGYFVEGNQLSQDVINRFLVVCKELFDKGYIFRHNGRFDDNLQNQILQLPNCKSVSFLPWKKFNIDMVEGATIGGSSLSYDISFTLHGKFSTLSPAARAICATAVRCLTGVNCNDPVDLYLCYNINGDETIKRGVDFKQLYGISHSFNVCMSYGIPIFNIKNDQSMNKLKNMIYS